MEKIDRTKLFSYDRKKGEEEGKAMSSLEIKDYLSQIGIRRITELDTALLKAFGAVEGERHIKRLTELFDQTEKRLVYGDKETAYLHRQEELVAYLNQSLQMSLLAASFYDRVFFRRVLEYLFSYDTFWNGNILDIGCGNGILTCFLALRYPEALVTGMDLSKNALSVARELAQRLSVTNVQFVEAGALEQRKYDTLFTCRTVHENIARRPLCEEWSQTALTPEEQIKRHEPYARELSTRIHAGGHLISVERYEEDGAYTGLIRALERCNIYPVKGTHMQFSCKNGDETATFQAMIFHSSEMNQ